MLVEYFRALVFSLALAHAYDVPVPYGVAVYDAAMTHDVNPFEMGALLMAENRSRRYAPDKVGTHNGGGELGLYQLQPYPWAKFCGLKPADLQDARANIDCAAQVSRHMMEGAGVDVDHPFWRDALAAGDDAALLKGMRRKTKHKLDWQVAYRCAPSARTSKNCEWSVKRVLAMHRALLKAYESRVTPAFWVATVLNAPVLLQRAVAAAHYTPDTDMTPTDLKDKSADKSASAE